MGDWLTAFERMAVVEAMKTSFVVYPLVNAAHILAIGMIVTCVMLMDLRLLGFLTDIKAGPFVSLLRRIAFGAFAIAILTGVAMFAIRASEYASMPLYWIKMGLILLAALNFMLFYALDRNKPEDAPLTGGARISVVISLVLWPAILITGRFLGFA